MRRREFITLIGGAAVARPLATLAQTAGKPPTVAYLGGTALVEGDWVDGLVRRLSELGWVEGRTVVIERRWSESRPERVAEIAAEYVQQKVDVIVTYGAAVVTLKKATTSIPIVFAAAIDPLGIGLVANLSRPGGNVTGLSLQEAELAGKRIGLLRQIVPNLRRLAILFDASYRGSLRELDNVQTSARDLGLDVAPHGVHRAEEIEPVLVALKGQADALYVVENVLLGSNGPRIAALALSMQLPTVVNTRVFATAGALMSYGPNVAALYQRAADYVDKILRGANPGELPVEQPTRFELVINLKSAKALGIEVPNSMQLLADEVIK